jgi:hypothetical protein
MAATWLPAAPAVVELRPSRISLQRSAAAASQPCIEVRGSAAPAAHLTIVDEAAICCGEREASRLNTPVPSTRASNSVDAAPRL